MKNEIIFIILFVLSLTHVQAQTGNEWTEQNKTQTKYLMEQIKALQSYAEVAAKGYDIARDGLGTIQSIRQGDYVLHADYFTSLKKVGPRIKSYWKVAATIALQIRILKQEKRERMILSHSDESKVSEQSYYRAVVKAFLDECEALVNELRMVIKDSAFQMNEAERLKRIDSLYAAMQDQNAFLQDFCADRHVLHLQQKHATINKKALLAFYPFN